MNRVITAFSLAALAALGARDLYAQSNNSGAGWTGLMLTPIGALTPMGPATANDTTQYRLQLRYGHWRFAPGDDNTHNLGLGVGFRTGSSRTTIELGYGHDASCDNCDYVMIGVDVDVPLIQPSENETGGLRVALNPAAGFGHPTDGSGTALSGALSVPVSFVYPVGRVSLIPFVSPGVGYGRLSADGESAGAERNILAGGIGIASPQSALRVTISAHKVFIDRAPTVYGIGLSVRQ
jgi:hypothetical protein